METTTSGAAKEKEIIKEIKMLENSRQYIEEIQDYDEQIHDLWSQKKAVASSLDDLKEQIKSTQEEIDELKKDGRSQQDVRIDFGLLTDCRNVERCRSKSTS